MRVTVCDPVSNLCGILETILNERLNKIQWGIRGSAGFFCLLFSLQDSKTLQICRCLKILQSFTKSDETGEEVTRAEMIGISLLYVWGWSLRAWHRGWEGRKEGWAGWSHLDSNQWPAGMKGCRERVLLNVYVPPSCTQLPPRVNQWSDIS